MNFHSFRILLSAGILVSFFSAAASVNPPTSSKNAEAEIQYFVGTVQPSSLDGKTPYGPALDSLVRRNVDREAGTVLECVFQKGQMFYTIMNRTSEPLVYSVRDSDDSFTGKLTFADETLSSWSYDIEVTKPNQGHISGQLPDYGAVITPAEKKMQIKKIWNNQVLMTENYTSSTEAHYAEEIKKAKAADPELVIPEACDAN